MNIALSSNVNFPSKEFGSDGKATLKGNCTQCENPAELVCMRCGDFYCSKPCQDIDWHKHRYICFPKPALVNRSSRPAGDDMPEIGVVEPVHIQWQLRVMADVCCEFMRELDNLFNCNTINSIVKDESNQSNEDLKAQKDDNLATKSPVEELQEASNTGRVDASMKIGAEQQLEYEHVYIVGFRASNLVALCPKESYDNGSYNDILNRINKHGQCASKINFVPQPGDYVLIEMKRYGSWNYARARVISQKGHGKFNDSFCVALLDYGNTSLRRPNEMLQITKELAELPVFVKLFQLDSVQHCRKTVLYKVIFDLERKLCKMRKVTGKSSIVLYDFLSGENLNDLIENAYRKKILKIDNCKANNNDSKPSDNVNFHKNYNAENLACGSKETELPLNNWTSSSNIELIKNDNAENLKCGHKETELAMNSLMPANTNVELCESSHAENLSEQTNCAAVEMRMLEPPFVEYIFPKNMRNAKAVILDTSLIESGVLACILQKHIQQLQEVHSYLNEKMEIADDAYQPVINEYVMAKFESVWYRGKVLKVSTDGETFDILFIDFLNESSLNSTDIRRYPKDLTTDSYTTLCAIDGLPKKFSENLKSFLKNTLEINQVIHIDRVVDILDERTALIECCDLLQIIRKKNLI